jgi:hypothetical protein
MARAKREDRGDLVEHTLTIRITAKEKAALEKYAQDLTSILGGGIVVTMGGLVRTLISAAMLIPPGKFMPIGKFSKEEGA